MKDLEPITREETLLAKVAGQDVPTLEPVTREEYFLAKAGGQDVPELEPVTRKEYFLADVIEAIEGGGGGGSDLGTKTISANGTYKATDDSLDGYSKVTVDVPASAVDSGTKSISTNGTHDVTGYASASVSVPNSYSAGDEGKVVSNGALVAQTSDTVTENDTYDTTLINSLMVNVSGGGGIDINAMADRSLLTGDIVLDTATSVAIYAFDHSNIENVESDSVKSISNYGFANCAQLETVDFPNLNGSIGSYTFQNCANLTSVNLPNLNAMGGYNFQDCKNLIEAMFPNLVKSGNSATGANTFRGCKALKRVDLGKCVRIDGNVFNGDSVFDTLILRKTSVCTLSNVNSFTGTPFESGGTGGHIYIPKTLYDALGTGTDDYRATTNWSTLDGYGTITWHAIEGSIYE